MNVAELRKQLEGKPDNMQVFLAGGKTEWEFGLLNSVRQDTITFKLDEESDESPAEEICVILDEE